jgi:rhamnose utilization protein RhaD (predicted bifunctional aldolase and dehydrogenase)
MHEVSEASLTKDFVEISRYAGSRFDLIQASGGNTSVKLDGNRLLIKASGVHLSEVNANEGYVSVQYPLVIEILNKIDLSSTPTKSQREADAASLVTSATQTIGAFNRASIEVYLHALLRKFVLHTHPLAVNMIACQKNWIEHLKTNFPDALFVPYATPGIELGILLNSSLNARKFGREPIPKIIFLQNHGLIVNSESIEDVLHLTDKVVIRCEEICGVDLSKYRETTKLNRYLGDNLVSYLSEDRELEDLLRTGSHPTFHKPFVPDTFVFCGVEPLYLKNLTSQIPLQEYRNKFHDTPKVVILNGRHYFIAKSIKKAKEIEDVYKAHILVLSELKQSCAYLSDSEFAYLGNWEAEKYRKEK